MLNKGDRPTCRPQPVESDLFNLFTKLGGTDDQADYPLLYASAKQGWVQESFPQLAPSSRNMTRVFDLIMSHRLVCPTSRTFRTFKPFLHAYRPDTHSNQANWLNTSGQNLKVEVWAKTSTLPRYLQSSDNLKIEFQLEVIGRLDCQPRSTG